MSGWLVNSHLHHKEICFTVSACISSIISDNSVATLPIKIPQPASYRYNGLKMCSEPGNLNIGYVTEMFTGIYVIITGMAFLMKRFLIRLNGFEECFTLFRRINGIFASNDYQGRARYLCSIYCSVSLIVRKGIFISI